MRPYKFLCVLIDFNGSYSSILALITSDGCLWIRMGPYGSA